MASKSRQKIINVCKLLGLSVRGVTYSRNSFGEGWWVYVTDANGRDNEHDGVTAEDLVESLKRIYA